MLKVSIYSFGFLYGGIPEDKTGNEGGFVFDCRFIKNPGCEHKYLHLTGKDKETQKYLEEVPNTHLFFKDVCSIIDKAIDNYLSRDFTHLMVSFGCTGGQHRSVYFAERLYAYLKQRDNIEISLTHCNL